jgi:putative intracellular protease/amidase/YHS domain-containing protein
MIPALGSTVPFLLALLSAVSPLAQEDAAAGVAEHARLTPPESGPIPVAFVLSPGATVIDFAGPWEVFQDVLGPQGPAFRLYTVAASREAITGSGGLRLVPDFTFEDAPPPRVIVVGAQHGSPGLVEWLRSNAARADLTLSVCTGAFHLAAAGLLDGRRATTHHEFYDHLAREHPQVRVERGLRWVEGKRVATAGGLSSGIDLALRVVARYFGEPVAERTARYMEYSGDGWHAARGLWDGTTDEQAASETQRLRTDAPAFALKGLDPVLLCRGTESKGRPELSITRGRYTYTFSSAGTRDEFASSPERFEIRFDGACGFMAHSGAQPGSGDPNRFLVHAQRVYTFASEACREGFAADPERYAER